MKYSLLLFTLLSGMLLFGCKKDSSNKNTIDTTPKMVQVIFTNNHMQSHIYYTINERTTSVHGLNGSFESLKDNVQVKIGDTLTAHMFTGADIPSNYSIKMVYENKELAYSDDVVIANVSNRIDLTHTFSEADFK